MSQVNQHNVFIDHMGRDFARLSPLLQQAHSGRVRLSGTSTVVQGNSLAKIICRIFRFPKPGENIDLVVDCAHYSSSFTWKRNFAGLKMQSVFKQRGEYLVEHLGPLAMSFKAEENNKRLNYRFYKTKFLGVPMPGFLSPRIDAGEQEVDGRYRFHVDVRMFLIGLVISYNGELRLEVME